VRPARRAMVVAVAVGVVLHTFTVLWVWHAWGYFGRGNVLAWLDFPVCLAYLQLEGRPLLLWSLAAGGLQWAAIAAGLTWLVGRSVR